MSNKAIIQQETIIIYKTKRTSKVVSVFDDYDHGSICLGHNKDNFFENDLELLKFVLKKAKESGSDEVNEVIDSVYAYKKGIVIEETWYDWHQIEPVFEKNLNE